MALYTAFTELFSLRHPIALAPMGGSAGGALAAAVSNGGGLGLLGGGNRDVAWLERELPIVAERTENPWGVGFQSWAINLATLARTLAHRPSAVTLSFGDPSGFVEPVRQARRPARAIDVAAALALGAVGALLGTRFQATPEALVDPAISKENIDWRGQDTERSRVPDIARGSRWPAKYPARTFGHPFLDQWRGREDELAANPDAQRA